MNGRHRKPKRRKRKKYPRRHKGIRKLRTLADHEPIMLIALALVSPPDVTVRRATEYEDYHKGTDLVLIRGRRKLYIDATTGGRDTFSEKKDRNDALRGKPGARKTWIIQISVADGVEFVEDPCFKALWNRMAGDVEEPFRLSPADACPEHGKGCPTIEKLESLGRRLVVLGLRKRPDWQRYFQDKDGFWVWMQ